MLEDIIYPTSEVLYGRFAEIKAASAGARLVGLSNRKRGEVVAQYGFQYFSPWYASQRVHVGGFMRRVRYHCGAVLRARRNGGGIAGGAGTAEGMEGADRHTKGRRSASHAVV